MKGHTARQQGERCSSPTLLHRSLVRFMACTFAILLLAAPLFYWVTKNFYAEDMIDIIESVQRGDPLPRLDLERDIVAGMTLQYLLTGGVFALAIVLSNLFIAKRLWRPFDETLRRIEQFRLEKGIIPPLNGGGTREFERLVLALQQLMENSLQSYRTQKEFTENASHELQTPLALLRSRLDLLLQQPGLTRQQAETVEELYALTGRLARLNRNLLLLARLDNKQYTQSERVDVAALLADLLPGLESLAGELHIRRDFRCRELIVQGNQALLEVLVQNLIVNAVRHNRPGGEVTVCMETESLTVTNTSAGEALDPTRLFNRFYRPAGQQGGNGLGLSIAKAVCDYHGWSLDYAYREGQHTFRVGFRQPDASPGHVTP